MTNEQIGTLIEAFANYYWSISAKYVVNKIMAWHPEITEKQMKGVLKKADGSFWHHFCLIKDGLEEPEIVVEHLVTVEPDDLDCFVDARIEGPYCDCDEETLLLMKEGIYQLDIPEVNAMKDFAKNELQLDEEWTIQLLDDCGLNQPYALFKGTSWVIEALQMERFGKIQFKTIDQVERFRDLGNQLYQALPNPVLKGWKPSDLENAPVPCDDIPEKAEDIPDGRKIMDSIFQKYGGREKVQQFFDDPLDDMKKEKKIKRNDPCPCGSGKKYKKCCGANDHPARE